jgi:hypothetical protein
MCPADMPNIQWRLCCLQSHPDRLSTTGHPAVGDFLATLPDYTECTSRYRCHWRRSQPRTTCTRLSSESLWPAQSDRRRRRQDPRCNHMCPEGTSLASVWNRMCSQRDMQCKKRCRRCRSRSLQCMVRRWSGSHCTGRPRKRRMK